MAINQNHYVFISYSSSDKEIADSIRNFLQKEGINCWMAPDDIPAGSKYAHVINDALENCACLLLILTNASQESQFVEREVERAVTYKKEIIPVRLGEVELNSGFRFWIGSNHIIEVLNVEENALGIRRIIDSIQKKLGITRESDKLHQCKRFMDGAQEILLITSDKFKFVSEIKNMIVKYASEKGQGNEILYMEEWINQLISSISSREQDSMNNFRNTYINCDVLVLDGVEELEGKEFTQNELRYFIRKRIDKGLKTVLISNVTIEELSQKIDGRLYDVISSENIIKN